MHLLVNDANRALIIGPVVTRVHRPITSFLEVPREGQLLQSPAACEVQVGARVIAVAEDEVNLLLFHIGLASHSVERSTHAGVAVGPKLQ